MRTCGGGGDGCRRVTCGGRLVDLAIVGIGAAPPGRQKSTTDIGAPLSGGRAPVWRCRWRRW